MLRGLRHYRRSTAATPAARPTAMVALRAIIARFPGLALLFLALVLLMKAWVPTGYMPMVVAGSLHLAPCSGSGVLDLPMAAPGGQAGPAPGMDHAGTHHTGTHHAGMDHATIDASADSHGHSDSAAQHAQMPCAFSGLSAPLLSGADPLLLAVALAFLLVVALHLPLHLPLLRRAARLRPPAQAPPVVGC